MEKQPDKLEVLMDWFLGDAKEITASQKEMTEKLSVLSEKLAKDTTSLGETADSLKRALVENQRTISMAINDDAKAREEFLAKFRRAQASSAETLSRQILFITTGCTIVGAAIGAAIAILVLK
ncbi:StbC [Salmonella enterica subsp. enterica serovar Meleagridis]|nr:StbC [Salmonella enterica subsp. enterica serovar Cerro]EGD4263619.1 StbC [Salmonella enterica subsp. enterica serovar Cerro]EGD4267970.1 StbC [Salmonella enterica subsp. enterica serovar Cerro]EGD4276614.1 StbC [Salmonella enterica subsp. enterica serovar Meleagridis]EGD4286617.1 StbC [Salmonella enterica subsp. enterica serovar Meleagridis]